MTIPILTVTPIGPDGSEYRVTQVTPQGARPLVIERGNTRSGCGFASAEDEDAATHPVATQYRLRIEYVYDDGVSGALESIAPVTPP